MLQIISGKFYQPGGDITERAAEGFVYSNTAYPLPIVTSIATLTLVDAEDGIGKYRVDYVARFEQRPGRVGLLRIGDSTIVEQFRLLALFSFRAYFATTRSQVVTTCQMTEAVGARNHPASYVRRFLDPVVELTPDDVERFGRFVDKVLAMPRKSYEKVIDCLGCFADALELVAYNMDLAYSMLVYCAEALSQGFDNFVAGWQDVPEGTRVPLDRILAGIDPASADGVRTVLLEQQHFKLTQRFINFLSDHLPESFYTHNADGLMNPIRPSELKKLLLNIYDARSKFVHELNTVRNQIKVSEIGKGEVFRTAGDPYLTFNGMVRLLHTAIGEFVRAPTHLGDRGICLGPGAVEDHSGRGRRASTSSATLDLGGSERVPAPVCPQVNRFLVEPPHERDDQHECRRRGVHRPSPPALPSEKDKLHMALLCELYFYACGHLPGVRELKEKYAPPKSRLNKPSIHTMLFRLLTGVDWEWTAEKSAELYTTYEKQRVSGEFSIPPAWELALMLEVANQFNRASNESECAFWKNKARLEATGNLARCKPTSRVPSRLAAGII